MDGSAFALELAALRSDVDDAVERILEAAEQALARLGRGADEDDVRASLCSILEACSIQDLAGQRIARMEALVRGETGVTDPLMYGPALQGAGLGQGEADALLGA